MQFQAQLARAVRLASPFALLLAALLVLTAGATGALARAHKRDGKHHAKVLFVAPHGHRGASDRSCRTAARSSVQAAVNAAPAKATVVVCAGKYTEDVIVSTPLTLIGHGAVIQASSKANGNCDQLGPHGPGSAPCLAGVTIKSSHVVMRGFTVRGAIGEGILATGSLKNGSIGDVRIDHNRVILNDRGGIPPTTKSPYPQCVEVGQIPGDCGEGIHLMGVHNSVVDKNFIAHNSGGVLLTDEFGPTHHNLVTRNLITENPFDCGVTAPGHNPFALDSTGHRQPSKAGVYANVIRGNRITKNGLKGEGAGVLFANAGPGTAAYDNLVVGNEISGNELSGVTMHAHTLAPGQFEDLSGNRIIGNTIGRNNVGSPHVHGDPLDGTVTDPLTTGVLVFSGTVRVDVKIAKNRISNNHYGVWLGIGKNVSAKLSGNRFHNVAVPVFTAP
jgi:hypothetical protein